MKSLARQLLFFALILVNLQNFAQAEHYNLELAAHKMDLQNGKITTTGIASSSSRLNLNCSAQIQFHAKSGSVTLITGTSPATYDLERSVDRFIRETHGFEVAQREEREIADKTYVIVARPVFDEAVEYQFATVAIEQRILLNKQKIPAEVPRIEIRNFVLTTSELKSHRFLGLPKVYQNQKSISDDQRTKIFVGKSEEAIYYVTVDFRHISARLAEAKTNLFLEQPSGNRTVIPGKFPFAIRYENSNGILKTHRGLNTGKAFQFEIDERKYEPPMTVEPVVVRSSLTGRLFPVGKEESEYYMQLAVELSYQLYDASGKKLSESTTQYQQDLTFSRTDIIEVRLPPNWPRGNLQLNFDPGKVGADFKAARLNYAIKAQKLIIKPEGW